MDEKVKEIIDQYDLEVSCVSRGRGAFVCETNHGLKLVKEYNLSPNRLLFESMVKHAVRDRGYIEIDQFNVNQQGELLSKNRHDRNYVVKDWYEGHECDPKNIEDMTLTARNLARLHKVMRGIHIENNLKKNYTFDGSDTVFLKHNRELKAIKNYIKNKHQKNPFEIQYLAAYDHFNNQGQKALKMLMESSYTALRMSALTEDTYCHGDYNHHNVIINNEKIATTNFDKLNIGIQLNDLYLFLRKVMEKNNWDFDAAVKIIHAYGEVKPISNKEIEYLYIQLLYPEKFWKIANHYYNTRKSWTSGRNIDKINAVAAQKEARDQFLSDFHSYFLGQSGLVKAAEYLGDK